jgi:hypothetical protein
VKLYISGPMTGLPEHNFPAFKAAAARLTAAGYDVLNPAENFGGRTDLERKAYMREDISNVLKADGIATLPGWQDSKGARLEVAIARELDLEAANVDMWVFWPEPEVANRTGRVLNRTSPDGINSALAIRIEHTPPPKQETILEEAQRLVHGDRGASYGHPADDFGRTAEYWTTTFKAKLKDAEKFEAGDIPMALICVKLSREVNKPKRDNMTDLAGYAETRRMVLEREGA